MKSGRTASTAALWGVLLALLARPALAAPLRLSLEDAVARATAANTNLRITAKDIATAHAAVERSRNWVPQNPYFSGGLLQTPQTGFGPNYGLNLSQEFEIAGQRSRRMAVADAALQSSQWEQRSNELNLAANVKLAFQHALLGVERVTLAQRGLDALAGMGTGTPARRESVFHAGSRIDRNLLVIQEARSRRELRGAELQREADLDNLRYLLSLPPEQALDLTGTVEREVRPLRPETDLIAEALSQRPDLESLRFDAERAAKQIPLVKREGIPNVTLQGSVSRFDDDTFAGGDVGFYLPVLRNNDPELLEALADRERTELAANELERSIEREVRDARRACLASGEDLALSKDIVVPRSRENLDLQRQRFERDEVGASELVGVLVDTQFAEREYIDAVQAYADAWIELERAIAGQP